MKVRIELTYRTPKGTETTFSSEEMRAAEALLIAEDLERTGRVKTMTFIDSRETTWTWKEFTKYMEGIQTEPHNVMVYFDGNYDKEMRRAGLGCAIYYEQNGKAFRLRKNALVDEINTNNEAEYAAFHLGLQELELLGVHHLPAAFVGDSQVVINQLNGEWPCYEAELNKWIDRIEEKLKQLGIEPDYQQVSRKRNREADQLAAQALREIEIMSTIETRLE